VTGGSNKCAFPVTPEIWATHDDFCGMTLRDYFAGRVVAQMMAAPNGMAGYSEIAVAAYEMADALLAKRERGR